MKKYHRVVLEGRERLMECAHPNGPDGCPWTHEYREEDVEALEAERDHVQKELEIARMVTSDLTFALERKKDHAESYSLAIHEAIEASELGKAGDAIQAMLDILDRALRPGGE